VNILAPLSSLVKKTMQRLFLPKSPDYAIRQVLEFKVSRWEGISLLLHSVGVVLSSGGLSYEDLFALTK
jgi:hypothetical protein